MLGNLVFRNKMKNLLMTRKAPAEGLIKPKRKWERNFERPFKTVDDGWIG